MKTVKLFIGPLTWNRSERVGDRYGMVYPHNDNSNGTTIGHKTPIDVDSLVGVTGKIGNLCAKVIETRQSTHIGDFFHGYSPQTPNVGDVIRLGEGTLTIEIDREMGPMVGVKPTESCKKAYTKKGHWMNPVNLYKCHEQTVEVYFEYKE